MRKILSTNLKLIEELIYKYKKGRGVHFNMVLASVAFFILSGFDYSRHSISLDDNSDGGPGKNEIPSIGNPHFLTVAEEEQSLIQSEDRVLGFVHN